MSSTEKTTIKVKINFDKSIYWVVAKAVYRGFGMAIKEYVANAIDNNATRIWIWFKPETGFKKITIIDNGEGMNKEKLRYIFEHIGASFHKKDLDKYGKYGIGLQAAARIGNEMKIFTRTKSDDDFNFVILPFGEWEKQEREKGSYEINIETKKLDNVLEEFREESEIIDVIEEIVNNNGSLSIFTINDLKEREVQTIGEIFLRTPARDAAKYDIKLKYELAEILPVRYEQFDNTTHLEFGEKKSLSDLWEEKLNKYTMKDNMFSSLKDKIQVFLNGEEIRKPLPRKDQNSIDGGLIKVDDGEFDIVYGDQQIKVLYIGFVMKNAIEPPYLRGFALYLNDMLIYTRNKMHTILRTRDTKYTKGTIPNRVSCEFKIFSNEIKPSSEREYIVPEEIDSLIRQKVQEIAEKLLICANNPEDCRGERVTETETVGETSESTLQDLSTEENTIEDEPYSESRVEVETSSTSEIEEETEEESEEEKLEFEQKFSSLPALTKEVFISRDLYGSKIELPIQSEKFFKDLHEAANILKPAFEAIFIVENLLRMIVVETFQKVVGEDFEKAIEKLLNDCTSGDNIAFKVDNEVCKGIKNVRQKSENEGLPQRGIIYCLTISNLQKLIDDNKVHLVKYFHNKPEIGIRRIEELISRMEGIKILRNKVFHSVIESKQDLRDIRKRIDSDSKRIIELFQIWYKKFYGSNN